MTQYVCDRCGSIHDKRLINITIPKVESRYNTTINRERLVDLCDSCVSVLQEWSQPQPQPTKKG